MKRRPRYLVAAVVMVAAATGCSGAADRSCGAIADEAIEVLQDTIDIVERSSDEELLDFLGNGSGTPAAFAGVEQRSDALVAAADEAGCTEAELRDLLVARSDRLDTDGDFGRFVLETLLDGAFFSDR